MLIYLYTYNGISVVQKWHKRNNFFNQHFLIVISF